MMSSKRKLDMSEMDFKYLHERLSLLAKQSSTDARSFLLFIKSLMPNSLKLRLLEYGFSKDNGDSTAAAQQLSQLCASHRDSLRDEVNTLFDGIKNSDRNSIDIFTKLTPTAQRDILSIYFEHDCEPLTKVDTLMCLLNSREIRAQSQLVPTLLAWTYDSLKEGELGLLRSVTDTPSESPNLKSPECPIELQSPVPKLQDITDEGEEGEVLGDDEEDYEEEEDDEVTGTKMDSNKQRAVNKILINVYKLKMAYELLPIMHKLSDTVKIDRKLLEGVTTNSLGFLCQYLSFYPPEPPIIGTEKQFAELCKVAPRDYLHSCLVMCSELLQWLHEIRIQTERSISTETTSKYQLKCASDLLLVFEQCMEEVRRHAAAGSNETTPKKRRSSQRKMDAHYNVKALVSQAACLFYYLLVDLGVTYFTRERSDLLTTGKATPMTYHPVDFSKLFPDIKPSPISTHGGNDAPILLLNRLWQYLKFHATSGKVSLGHKDIDSWMGKLGFQPSLGTSPLDASLATLIYADLLFLHPEYFTIQFDTLLSDLFSNTGTTLAFSLAYSSPIRDFLHWLSVAYDVALPDTPRKPKNKFQLQSFFIQQLPAVANPAPLDNSLPKHIQGNLWMLPFVQPLLDYVSCKLVASWLSMIFQRSAALPDVVQVDIVSLIACLSQVDTLTQFSAIFFTQNTSPFAEVLKLLKMHWSHARKKFMLWLKRSPRIIEDSGLLSQLARLEVEYRNSSGTNLSSECSDFLPVCVEALKSTSKENICSRLRGFIESETDTILSCLEALG